MPNFFKAAAKFAGFAEHEAAEALRFEHFASEGTLTTTVFKGEGKEAVGFITTDVAQKSAYVASSMIFTPRQGIGRQAYKAIAQHLFETTGIEQLTSDITHGTSNEARGMWGKLLTTGEAEPFLYQKEDALAEGWRITRGTMNAAKTATERMLAADAILNKTIMHLGQGSSTTSMLNRSINNPVKGAKKMTGAL